MTTTYTPEARAKLEDYLSTHDLPSGLGDEESACSVAAINLALTGDLTDDIPVCMSEVLGGATIALQDSMPYEMRNSDRYKAWLPTAAGTGRNHEQERLAVLMDWMWGTVLPQLQGLADEREEFGSEWRRMCEQRTKSAAEAAAAAAPVDFAGNRADRDAAARAARAVARAYTAADAADAAYTAADVAFAPVARVEFWRAVDPIGVLERMTKIGEDHE